MPSPAPATPARRRFIELLGGGAVMAAAPLSSGCISSGMPRTTVEAWAPSAPSADSDARRFMLAHALLAPNPHNRQPWLADLRRDGEISLVLDKDRLLPETDPFGRQIIVGCGAFIELAVIAAAERGLRVDVQAFPDGEPAIDQLPGAVRVARLVLTPQAGLPRDPLFAHVFSRHTNKGAYDSTRALAPAQWQQLTGIARSAGLVSGAVTDPSAMNSVRALTRASYEIESTTPRTWLESARLLRIGPDEIEQHRDGISINAAMPRLLTAVGLFDRMAVPVRGSSGYQRVMDRWQPFETASGYLWLASRGGPGNARSSQLASGRAYVRTQLQAQALGVDMHPLSQALQEFPEVREQYVSMHKLLGLDPATSPLQMLVRVGYGVEPAGPSPRRPLAQMLRT
jgi:hypothetical protein